MSLPASKDSTTAGCIDRALTGAAAGNADGSAADAGATAFGGRFGAGFALGLLPYRVRLAMAGRRIAPGFPRPAVSRSEGADAKLDRYRAGGRSIDLDSLVSANIGLVVGGLLVVVLALVLAVVGLIRRTGRLARRLESITRGSDEQSLEAVLGSHLERVRQVVKDVAVVSSRTTVLERDLQGAYGRVGLVRFNPFEDTGGNQSFALALLDGRGDGFIVSSLHSRTGTRIYAKTIAGGASEAALSEEETTALKQALAMPPAGAGG